MSLPPRNAKVYAPSTQYGDLNKVLTAEPVTYNVFRAKTGIFGERMPLKKTPQLHKASCGGLFLEVLKPPGVSLQLSCWLAFCILTSPTDTFKC